MSARDDYPPSTEWTSDTRYYGQMCDEIDRLRTDLSALTAVVAAVHTALDQYDDGLDTTRPFIAVLDEFVSAVAKAVRP